MKENIKTIIILIIIFAACIIGIFIYGKEKNSDKLVSVDMPNLYFLASKYANNYISKTSTEDIESIYNILYSKFIEENEINNSNLLNKINVYPESSNVEIKNVSYVEENNNFILYLKGIVYKYTVDNKEILDNDFELIIIIDNENSTFAVYPTTKRKYKSNMNKIILKKINISKNNDNDAIPSEYINKEKMCVLYMNDFIDKINNSDDNGYSYMSEDMLQKYNKLSVYKNMIIKNKDKLSTVADKCTVKKANSKNENNKKYIVIDKNNNKFEFTENAVMDYKVDIHFNNENN